MVSPPRVECLYYSGSKNPTRRLVPLAFYPREMGGRCCHNVPIQMAQRVLIPEEEYEELLQRFGRHPWLPAHRAPFT